MDYSKLQNGSDIRGVALEGIEGQHINLTEEVCRNIGRGFALWLKDRLGKEFPVLREDSPKGTGHRNLVCNSLPTGMSDRMDDLARAHLGHHHYVFTVESPAEVDRVIAAYRERKPLPGEVRRMVK